MPKRYTTIVCPLKQKESVNVMEINNLLGENLFGSKKEKIIETNELQIRGHLLRWKDVVIQISNISLISVGNYPRPPFPMWTIAVILIGIIAWPLSILIGAIVLAVGIAGMSIWYESWWPKKDYKFLHLYLNSGQSFSFMFEEESFLRKVLDVFANIFEDVEKNINNSVTIDIKNCSVRDNGRIVETINSGK